MERISDISGPKDVARFIDEGTATTVSERGILFMVKPYRQNGVVQVVRQKRLPDGRFHEWQCIIGADNSIKSTGCATFRKRDSVIFDPGKTDPAVYRAMVNEMTAALNRAIAAVIKSPDEKEQDDSVDGGWTVDLIA